MRDVATPAGEVSRTAATAKATPCPTGGSSGTEPCCTACAPLVDDGAVATGGQMAVGAFLDRVRADVAAAIDTELADLGMTSQDCPYLDYWVGHFRGRSAAQVTAFVRRYTGSADLTPAGMARAVRDRVVVGARAYRASHPTSAPTAAPTKVRSGRGGTAELPTARDALVLGAGRPLDGATRGRMEGAFGTGLGHLRVHTGERAADLTGRLGARAVAVGDDMAFAPGELSRPGLDRDLLVAHEVAHSLQQRGATGEVADATVSPSMERDADRSAALVASRLLLGDVAPAANAMPRRRGGLGLGRCAAAAAPAIGVAAGAGASAGAGAGAGISLSTILAALGLGTIAVTLESDQVRTEPATCETTYPTMPECWMLPDEYVFNSPAAALTVMKTTTGEPSLSLHSPSPTTSGPCPGVGTHYNVRSGGARAGSITCCPCCSDDAGGPVLEQRCRIVW